MTRHSSYQRSILLLLLLCLSHLSHSQTPAPVFINKSIGNGQNCYIYASTRDQAGNVYVTGVSRGDNLVNGSGQAPALISTTVSGNSDDIFVIKYNSAGVAQWQFAIGNSSAERGNAIAVDANGYIYVAGYINGTSTVDMDPSSNTNNLTGAGDKDIFVAKYDGNYSPSSTSFYKWAFKAGGTNGDQVNSIAVDNSGGVYISGYINGTTAIDMDPSSNSNTITGAGSDDVFLAKYDGTTTPSSTSFYQWSFVFGSTNGDIPGSLTVDASKNVYVSYALYGNTAVDMDPSSNSNTVTGAGASSYDMVIAKYDGTQTPSSTSFYQWAFITGVNSANEIPTGMAVDNSNYLYITGNFNGSSVDMDPSTNTNALSSTGGFDIFVLKYDATQTPSGTSFYQWAFKIGSGNDEGMQSLAIDGKGGLYLAGYKNGNAALDMDPSSNTNNITGNGSNDIIVAKYDVTQTPSGTSFYKWAFAAGNANVEQANTISVDSSQRVFIGGYTYGIGENIDMDPGTGTYNILPIYYAYCAVYGMYDGSKTPSTSGFTTYANTFGDAGCAVYPTNSAIDANGNIYVVGYFTGHMALNGYNANGYLASKGGYDVFVAKYNNTGVLQWAFPIGGMNDDQGYGIAVDNSGYVYISGQLYGTIYYTLNIDMDPSSNTNNVGLSGGNDIFVAKYNGNLTPSSTSFYQWAFRAGGNGTECAMGIALDGTNLYVTGNLQGSSGAVDMDPSSNTNTITSSSNYNLYLAKYDVSLTPSSTSFYQWAFVTGNSTDEQPQDIAVDGSGGVYISGNISGTSAHDMDPSTNSNTITGAGAIDIFVVKYDGSTTPSSTSFYQWAFATGSASGYESAGDIAVDASKNVYITGNTQQYSVDIDPTSGTTTFSPAGNNDAYLAKYDGSLTPSSTSFFKWGFLIGGSGDDLGYDIRLDGSNNLYLTGQLGSSSVDMDPSSNTNSISTNGSSDIMVAKYDVSLTPSSTSFHKFSFAAGKTTGDVGYTIAADSKGFALAGQFSGTNTDFFPGSNTYYLTSSQLGAANTLFAGYYATKSWTGATSTDWFTTSNWSDAAVPTSSDYAIIPSGLSRYPNITTGTASCSGLSIYSGASTTVSGGTLQVAGSINNNGTLDATGGTLVLNGSAAQSVENNGTLTATNLTLNNSAGATLSYGTVNVLDTYTPTSGTLTAGGNLTLKSTATGTARIAAGSSGGGYLSGNLTIERYIPARRAFRFMAHPFTSSLSMSDLTDDIDITGSGGSPFTTTNTNNPSAFYFDVTAGDNTTSGNNPGWTAFTASSNWNQYQAMRVLIRGTKGQGLTSGSYTPAANTIDLSGAVNQGDVTVNLTKGSSTNFVLVGNPFPSQVNMDGLTNSNVGSAFYIWDANQGTKGGYTSYTYGSSSFNLPSCGAFVTTLTASGSITFAETAKSSGTAGSMFKTTAPANTVQLRLEDSTTFWDRLLLRFDNNTMAAVDYSDAVKLYNPDMSFYTWSSDDSMLSIDARPYAEETIKLGLYSTLKKNFRIIAADFNMPLGTKLFLHDKYLNKTEEITGAGYEYWFSVDASTASWGDSRFELTTSGQPVNGIASANHSDKNLKVKLAPNPAKDLVTVFFEGANNKQVTVTITDITGAKVAQAEKTAQSGSISIPVQNLGSGMYIVNISCGSETITQKLIKQ